MAQSSRGDSHDRYGSISTIDDITSANACCCQARKNVGKQCLAVRSERLPGGLACVAFFLDNHLQYHAANCRHPVKFATRHKLFHRTTDEMVRRV